MMKILHRAWLFEFWQKTSLIIRKATKEAHFWAKYFF
jgi:hypothetical protein